jgi:multiple antibiotic resistance protein
MLRARRSPVQETSEETDAGAAKDDIAITPLAVPMLAGPGAITTAIVLQGQADSVGKQLALLFAISAVAAASYLIFRVSAHGAKWLSPIALRLVTRIMGLLLAAVACQFAFDALKSQKLVPP